LEKLIRTSDKTVMIWGEVVDTGDRR